MNITYRSLAAHEAERIKEIDNSIPILEFEGVGKYQGREQQICEYVYNIT